MRRAIVIPFVLGLLIRVLLMPITMHDDARFVGDIVAMHVDAKHFATPPTSTSVDIALYPPLAYYTLDGYRRLVSIALTDLNSLEKDGSSAREAWYSHPQRFLRLFLLKLWYLPFDMLCGVLLLRLVEDDAQKIKKIQLAWMWYLNPIVIYTGAIHGQFDVVPVFFTVLSLVAIQREQWLGASAALALGAAFKLYPALFVVPLLIIMPRNKRHIAAFIAFVILALPFMGKLGFYSIEHSYYSNGLAGVVTLTQGQGYYVFVAAYVLFLWCLAQRGATHITEAPLDEREASGVQVKQISAICLLILVGYYLQATFDLHYLMWVVPFALLQWMNSMNTATRYAWLIVLMCGILLTARAVPFGFLLPLNEAYFVEQANLDSVLARLAPLSLTLRLVHSVMIGTLLWLGYQAWREIAIASHENARA